MEYAPLSTLEKPTPGAQFTMVGKFTSAGNVVQDYNNLQLPLKNPILYYPTLPSLKPKTTTLLYVEKAPGRV